MLGTVGALPFSFLYDRMCCNYAFLWFCMTDTFLLCKWISCLTQHLNADIISGMSVGCWECFSVCHVRKAKECFRICSRFAERIGRVCPIFTICSQLGVSSFGNIRQMPDREN